MIYDDTDDEEKECWQPAAAAAAAVGGNEMSSWPPILRHCLSQPNLTEPLDIDTNEENG